jgi:hypothetical protein
MFKKHKQKRMVTFAWMGTILGLLEDFTRAKLCSTHSHRCAETSAYLCLDCKESRMAMRLQEHEKNDACHQDLFDVHGILIRL